MSQSRCKRGGTRWEAAGKMHTRPLPCHQGVDQNGKDYRNVNHKHRGVLCCGTRFSELHCLLLYQVAHSNQYPSRRIVAVW